MLLAMLAALAMSALAASAASAAELEQVPASGKFTVSAAKGGTFETHGKTSITCTKATGSGEVTGVKTDKSKVTFEGCTGTLGVKCTAGSKSGSIETEINSELVWLNKSSKIAGQKLALAKELSISCSILKVKVKGASLCPVEPVNTKTTTFSLVCKQSGGKQEYTEYENESGEKAKAITETELGAGWEESGLSSTESLTFSESVEIKVA